MKFPEMIERLDIINRKLGNKAMGYRLRRELKKMVLQYEKDIELVEAFHNSRDREQLLQVQK
jgi:hypothetical protein